MKSLLSIALALFATTMYAQQPTDRPDVTGTTHPHLAGPVPCVGSSNQGVDPDWKPILTLKIEEAEHPVPDERYLDSIKAAKLSMITANGKTKEGEKSTSATPVVGPNFIGNIHNGMTPLDNSVAISNSGNIVSVTNHVIACYDQAGTNHYYSDIVSFLPTSFSASAVCDPVVLYDANADRFVFFCQEYSTSFSLFSNNRIFISFSKSNNPAVDGWWCYAIQGDPTTNGDAFDYPKLAVNDSELYITGNLYSEPANTFHQAVLYQMYKYPCYGGSSMYYYYYTNIANSPFTLLPVSNGQPGAYGPGTYLVSTRATGSTSIDLYKVTANSCCSPVLNHWSIPTTAYSPSANAEQSGTSCLLNTGDCRALSGFWLNNVIHFVFNCDGGSGYTSINYNRLNTSSLTNVSSTFGLSGYHYTYAAVSSFATTSTDKSVLIGFGRSGSTIMPEIRAVNCDNGMNWSGSVLVHSSSSYIDCSSSTTRWGDYTGNSRRHNAPWPSAWVSGSFGNSSNVWDTWIAEIHPTGSAVSNVGNSLTASKVYPNPVYEDFSVEFTVEHSATIAIAVYDMAGRKVKELYNGRASAGENIFSFNKANLTNGIYILEIQTPDKIIRNEKIIIAR